MTTATVVDETTVRLFGGIDARGPLGTTGFSGIKQRAIVARLALDAGRVVSVERLIDDVWGDDAPATVRASIQVHVSQIRRALGDCGLRDVLATRPNGYVLDLPADDVDAARFERLVQDTLGHAADARFEHAAISAFAAIALWVGDPLPGIRGAPFAQQHATLLGQRRIDLLVAATDAAITVGRAGELVRELELAANANPYHEPLWAALAKALYATDRQTDALDRLTTLRRTIRDELGLEATSMVAELEHQILTHDLAVRPAASATASIGRAVRSNVPAPRRLVGRDVALTELGALLDRPGQVTLLGPAGVGKTALAVALAHLAADRRRDGATFVDLASVADGEDVVVALAAALSLRPSTTGDTQAQVCELLRSRDSLVVLDNCEHVREVVGRLVDELVAAPELTVLATSRVPIEGVVEHIVPIAPLPAAAAIEMFLARAAAADPAYEPTDDDLGAIGDLVQEVGGLALGIELAASLVRMMTPGEILDHVRRTHGPTALRPPAHSRHRSMDDAIDRSVDLLGAPARELFGRIGLVLGGTDLAGVNALCDEGARIDGVDGVDALRELVDASLVVADRTPAGTWYRMLFPIQVNAAARATASADSERVMRRWIRQLVADVHELVAAIEGSDPAPAIAGLDRRAPSIRQAYAFLDAEGDREGVQDLLAAIGPVASTASSALPDAADWFAAEVAHLRPPLERRLRIELGVLWYYGMTSAEYEELAERAVAAAREVGDRAMLVLALALRTDGMTDYDSHAAVEMSREMVELARDGAPWLFGLALNFTLNPLLRTRRFDEAEALLDEAFARGIDRLGIYEPIVEYQAGRLALARHDLATAEHHYLASERAALRHATMHGQSYAMMGYAQVAIAKGDLVTAQKVLLADAEFSRVVCPREIWSDLAWAAIVSIDLGDEPTIQWCIDQFTRVERPMEQCGYQLARAALHLVRGEHGPAREHLGLAMDAVLDIASLEWFGDLIGLWARTAPTAAHPELDRLRAGVFDRTLTPREAMHVMTGLPLVD